MMSGKTMRKKSQDDLDDTGEGEFVTLKEELAMPSAELGAGCVVFCVALAVTAVLADSGTAGSQAPVPGLHRQQAEG